MQKLDTKQINNLITGKSLALEISSTSDDTRAFIVVHAYQQDGHIGGVKVSRYLNSIDKSRTLFWLRKYEIEKEYIENEWDVSDDELINSIFIKDIKDIGQLEIELSKYLSDFSSLDVEWKCDNPI